VFQRVHQGIERERKKLAQVARCAALGQLVDQDELEVDQFAVDEAAAAFGLAPVFEHAPAEPIYLWPENVRAWNFFQAVGTQWVVEDGAAIGLNYQRVTVVRDAQRVKAKDWPSLFSALQAMERATLAAWRERNK